MAGSLVHIGSQVAGGSDATFTITGIDSTYDVYLVQVKNLIPSSDDTIAWRITKSGSIQTDNEYDNGRRDKPFEAAFQNNEDENASGVTNATVESTGDGFFAEFYLFNFANASEYSYGLWNAVMWVSTPQGFSSPGGFVHTVASASDGLSFYFTGGGNVSSGNLELYGLKK